MRDRATQEIIPPRLVHPTQKMILTNQSPQRGGIKDVQKVIVWVYSPNFLHLGPESDGGGGRNRQGPIVGHGSRGHRGLNPAVGSVREGKVDPAGAGGDRGVGIREEGEKGNVAAAAKVRKVGGAATDQSLIEDGAGVTGADAGAENGRGDEMGTGAKDGAKNLKGEFKPRGSAGFAGEDNSPRNEVSGVQVEKWEFHGDQDRALLGRQGIYLARKQISRVMVAG